MQITMTGDGIEITDSLKKHLQDKLERLGHKIHKGVAIHVTFSLEGSEQVAKALLNEHGIELYASAKAENLYTAIDELVKKMTHEIEKHKGKIKEKRRDKPKGYGAETL